MKRSNQKVETLAMLTQKSWISPFVAVTFVAVAVTGILLLFHLKLPSVFSIHKWGGLVLVVGGTIHLLLNWQTFISYFRRSSAVWGAVLGILILILITLVVPSKDRGNGYHGNTGNSYRYGLSGGNPQ